MRKHINMGSVSHGTMRAEDLIPAFIDCLEMQKPCKRAHRSLIAEIQNTPEDEQEEYLESLFDALNEYAAPYFYFGAHPGDGSDYGFWLSESWDEDFCRDSKCSHQNCSSIVVDDSTAIPKGFTGEAGVITDHGNVTLYSVVRGRKYEVWSIV